MALRLSKPASRSTDVFGFSILELSIVVAILAVVSVMGLEVAAAYTTRRAYSITQDRMAAIDTAIKQYYHTMGYLPCPTPITNNLATDTGIGDCTTTGLTAYIASGGLPFRDLGLPISAILDGYGSKIRYFVTISLTTNAGFSNIANYGHIEVRTGQLSAACGGANLCEVTFNPIVSNPADSTVESTGAVYAILSSGSDQRGGYNKFGVLQKACQGNDTHIDGANCVGGTTNPVLTKTSGDGNDVILYDSRFNNGNVVANYFDDIIIVRGKGDLQ